MLLWVWSRLPWLLPYGFLPRLPTNKFSRWLDVWNLSTTGCLSSAAATANNPLRNWGLLHTPISQAYIQGLVKHDRQSTLLYAQPLLFTISPSPSFFKPKKYSQVHSVVSTELEELSVHVRLNRLSSLMAILLYLHKHYAICPLHKTTTMTLCALPLSVIKYPTTPSFFLDLIKQGHSAYEYNIPVYCKYVQLRVYLAFLALHFATGLCHHCP